MNPLYKIQLSDGRYSRGGSRPSFDHKGKHWFRKCDVSNHLACLDKGGIALYESLGARILELKIAEEAVNVFGIAEWRTGASIRRAKREKNRVRKQQEAMIRFKLAELKRLQETIDRLKVGV